MIPWSFQAIDSTTGRIESLPLPFTAEQRRCRLRLRSLPGAQGLHLACAAHDAIRWRFEVPATEEEKISLHLELDAAGELHAWSENRALFVLPPDERFAPLAPARREPEAAELELIFVIDGTARGGTDGPRPQLVASDRWPKVVERLVELARELGTDRKARLGVLAFGDEKLSMLDAPDLQPRYKLWPTGAEGLRLPLFSWAELPARLAAVPPTSGGDFVDALADALAVCAELPLPEQTQRIIVMLGDSPGHSLADPAPEGADFLPRAQEIEGPLGKLHAMGALVATIFHDPGFAADPNWNRRQHLPEFARRQYVTLASVPELAFELAGFQPSRAAQAIQRVPRLLGFGCCYGVAESVIAEASSPPGP